MERNSPLKTIKLVAKHQWERFCSNTSLHGWKYIVLQKTTKFERYLWLAICLISLGVSIFLLSWSWLKFQSNPTVTVIESTQYPVYKVLFSAVTICSSNKISKSEVYQLAKQLKSGSATDTESLANRLKLLLHLLVNDSQKASKEEYEDLHRIIEDSGKTEEEVFKQIAPSCKKLLKKCMWNGENKPCDMIFEQIKTSNGFCCAFNYFALKNRSRIGPFSNRLPKNPQRTSSCGYQSGLEVLIDNDPVNYFAARVPSIGFRVQVHNPYDFPEWTGPNVLCEIGSSNFIGLNPEMITATEYVKSRSVSERNCLFSRETELEVFDKYSFHNCMIECKLALSLELCGCVPFYLHTKSGFYGSTRVCTLRDVPCISENEDLIYNETFMDKKKREKGGKCNCLPNCEGTTYVSEASKGVLDSSYCTNRFSVYSDANVENHTIIRVFFNDLMGTKHRRDVLFTWYTLMGYYGGILGLFTGFSFISAVEIIYFAVIRFLTNGGSEIQTRDKMMTRIWAKEIRPDRR